MSKYPAFIIGTNVLKEEIRQQCLLEIYIGGYFGIPPEELEFKYPESSHTVLLKMMKELVGDQKLFYDWLFDEYDKTTGLPHKVETLCGRTVEMYIHTADDLYDCICFGNAKRVNSCSLCRETCRKYGLRCR